MKVFTVMNNKFLIPVLAALCTAAVSLPVQAAELTPEDVNVISALCPDTGGALSPEVCKETLIVHFTKIRKDAAQNAAQSAAVSNPGGYRIPDFYILYHDAAGGATTMPFYGTQDECAYEVTGRSSMGNSPFACIKSHH